MAVGGPGLCCCTTTCGIKPPVDLLRTEYQVLFTAPAVLIEGDDYDPEHDLHTDYIEKTTSGYQDRGIGYLQSLSGPSSHLYETIQTNLSYLSTDADYYTFRGLTNNNEPVDWLDLKIPLHGGVNPKLSLIYSFKQRAAAWECIDGTWTYIGGTTPGPGQFGYTMEHSLPATITRVMMGEEDTRTRMGPSEGAPYGDDASIFSYEISYQLQNPLGGAPSSVYTRTLTYVNDSTWSYNVSEGSLSYAFVFFNSISTPIIIVREADYLGFSPAAAFTTGSGWIGATTGGRLQRAGMIEILSLVRSP